MPKLLLMIAVLTYLQVYDEKDLTENFQKAQQYAKDGNYELAVTNYERFIFYYNKEYLPEIYLEEATYGLASNYQKLRASENAIIHFKRYLNQYPHGKYRQISIKQLNRLNVKKAFFILKNQLYKGHFDQAQRTAHLILDLDPFNTEAQEYLLRIQSLKDKEVSMKMKGYIYSQGQWQLLPSVENALSGSTQVQSVIQRGSSSSPETVPTKEFGY